MTQFAQAAFNTITTASLYTLVAVGFTLLFGVSKVVNIAYGDFLSLGAYMAFVIAPGTAISFIWGFGVSMLSVGVFCVLLERFVFRRTYLQPINGFLVSLGLVQVIEYGLQYLYSYDPPHVRPVVNGVMRVGGLFLPSDAIVVIVGSCALLVSLMLFLERTRIGLAIRSITNDRELAAMMGVPVSTMIATVFFIGGVIAGAGGGFLALIEPASPYLGADLIVRGLVVALIGGLGSVRGALVAAVALATLETVIVWGLASFDLAIWLDPMEFGLAIVLLVIRPRGLFGGVAGAA